MVKIKKVKKVVTVDEKVIVKRSAAAQKKIDKSNALFEKMTPKERRIAIVKDALKQISRPKVKVSRNNYCLIDLPKNVEAETGDNYQEVLASAKSCTVCALGSLFLANVELFDSAVVSYYEKSSKNRIAVDQDVTLFNALKRAGFESMQMALIETAFETDLFLYDRHGISYESNKAVFGAALRFGKSHKEPKNRLQAIPKNILKNDGTFVP